MFDTIAERAKRLCGAEFCFVFDSTDRSCTSRPSRPVGRRPRIHARNFPTAPDDGRPGRSILTHAVQHIPDVRADPGYNLVRRRDRRVPQRPRRPHDARRASDRRDIVNRTRAPGLSPAGRSSSAETFADQAVIAIQNVRLFQELWTRKPKT